MFKGDGRSAWEKGQRGMVPYKWETWVRVGKRHKPFGFVGVWTLGYSGLAQKKRKYVKYIKTYVNATYTR